MKVALIGAGSSVGRHLLLRNDPRFIGIYRSAKALSQLCDLDLGDRLIRASNPAALSAAIKGCDTVVTLINDENPRSALLSLRQTMDACVAAGVRQLIHISSAAIYGRNAHQVRSVDAAGPSLTWSSYAAGKQWQENFLKQSAARLHSVVVLRPGLIWGPGMAWLHVPAGDVLRGEAWIAEGDAPCNLVHIDLLTHAIVSYAESCPSGLSFCNLFDRKRMTWSEYYRRIAQSLKVEHLDIHVIPRKASPPWLRNANAPRFMFPLGLGWSVSPRPLKDFVKTLVRSIPKKKRPNGVQICGMGTQHLSINREMWELKTVQGLPPHNQALEQLHDSLPRSESEQWAEIGKLDRWLWI